MTRALAIALAFALAVGPARAENISVTPSSGGGSGGSGTVNAGLINQLGYYAAGGTAISGAAGANWLASTSQLSIGPGPLTPGTSTNIFTINANAVAVPNPDAGAATSLMQIVGADGQETSATVLGFIDTNREPRWMCAKARGTGAAPTALVADDAYCDFTGRGWDGTQWTNQRATIKLRTINAWSATDHSSMIVLTTIAKGVNTATGGQMLAAHGSGGLAVGHSYVSTGYLTSQDPGDNAILTGAYMLGGVTSSFPALYNSGAILKARLADNSADAAFTALSLNGNTFTTGTYTLTGGAGKVLTFNNTLTITATDGITMTTPTTSFTAARTDAAQGFTGLQTITNGATLPTPAAASTLQIANATTGQAGLEVDAFANQGNIIYRRAQTSSTAPSALTSGLIIGATSWQGNNATSYVAGARMLATTTATTWDASHNGAYLSLFTTADASATITENLRLQGSGGLSVGNANIATDGGAGVVVATSFTGAGTGLTGTAASLTAGAVTTNANLTGPITSVGNATSIAAQTGTGSVIAVQTNPVFVGPTLGVATGTSLSVGTSTAFTVSSTGATAVANATASSSPTTGALTVAGGMGINADLWVNSSNNLKIGSSQYGAFTLMLGGRLSLNPPSDGILTVQNNGQTDFGRMQFGGTTSAFPAIKRSSAALAFRLADDSADAAITTAAITASGITSVTNTTDATSTTTGSLQVGGGASFTKRVFAAGLTASAGLQTAVICLSSANELIADSVACLASSERFKQDIAPSDLGLAAVMAMKPIVYRYAPTGNDRFDNAPNQRDIHAGFRAEDLAKIDRRLVAFDADGAVRTARQDGITASLVKAVQEQQAQINALRRLAH